MERFKDRRDAGRRLAERLTRYRSRPDLVVVALPRGGVPVAEEVARALEAPLDVLVVRKLGFPGDPELAMGAIARGGVRKLNTEIVVGFGIEARVIDEVAARELQELERRERAYRGGRAALDLKGKTVILVDDGVATGATMLAAIEAVRRLDPAAIVAGIPAASPRAWRAIRAVVDEVVCLATPQMFLAIGEFYDDFSQTTDEEVVAALARRASRAGPPGPAPPRPEPSLDEKVAFLRQPASYPEKTGRVETVETHMSWVFLTDRHAYKMKKPVRRAFLDFATVEARRANCEAELRLNRRLAPDVYLSVEPITKDAAGTLNIGGEGPAVEWLVKMRRLDGELMLDQMIRRGLLREEHVRRVASILADFYRAAPPVAMAPSAYVQRIERDIRADRDELLRPAFDLRADVVERVATEQLAFVAREAGMLEERVRQGRIIEAHGDLRPEHVCLEARPVIIDCLEFNEEFRSIDPADELAFFSMECELLGAMFVGPIVFETYRSVTGDGVPDALVRFYESGRARLRAKLAAWHLLEPGRRDAARWSAKADAYLGLAASYLPFRAAERSPGAAASQAGVMPREARRSTPPKRGA